MTVTNREFTGVLFYNGADLIGTFDGARISHFTSKTNLRCPDAGVAGEMMADLESSRESRAAELTAIAKRAVATRAANLAKPAAPTAIILAPETVATIPAETVARVTSGARRAS